MLKISVLDSGIGMSADESECIFETFSRTDNVNSLELNPLGNRIGLSICKQICSSLEGNIRVKSTLGRGSNFTFTMKVFNMNSRKAKKQVVYDSTEKEVSIKTNDRIEEEK